MIKKLSAFPDHHYSSTSIYGYQICLKLIADANSHVKGQLLINL